MGLFYLYIMNYRCGNLDKIKASLQEYVTDFTSIINFCHVKDMDIFFIFALMLSNQSKYAIRAVLYLAVNADVKNKIRSKVIAEQIEIPGPFLAKIFQTLSKAKIISSAKGPNGGFYLKKEEQEKTILDIIECIDGLSRLDECFIGLPKCDDENPCAIHHIIAPFKKELKEELSSKTIAEFAEETKKGKSFIFLK